MVTIVTTVKKERRGGSSVVECVLCMGSIISTKTKKQEDKRVCLAELRLSSDSVTPLVRSSGGLGRLSRAHRQGHSTGHTGIE